MSSPEFQPADLTPSASGGPLLLLKQKKPAKTDFSHEQGRAIDGSCDQLRPKRGVMGDGQRARPVRIEPRKGDTGLWEITDRGRGVWLPTYRR